MARYAFSDLHGQLSLYHEIKKFVKPNDELYCLGDCGDRGPHPWETIKAIFNDPQIVYLKGNHEDMLVGAMAEYLGLPLAKSYYNKYPKVDSLQYLLAWNGGSETLQGWINEGADPVWTKRLEELPTLTTVTNEQCFLVLTHAGFTIRRRSPIPNDYDLMWDRNHIHETWPSNVSDAFIIVHGHTPCPTLVNKWKIEDGALHYCNGHKINLDVGSYYTGMACLLDLDSFDEHYFFAEGDKVKIENT